MKAFWEGIANLFVNFLFKPFDALRTLELDNWWLANSVSWILVIIGIVAFVYWMLQLRSFDKNGEENKSVTSHSSL